MEDVLKLQLLFQTLGDSNRLKIIRHIGEGESSVSEIVEITGLSQPLVSHHLRTMRESQILVTNRKGPFVYYKLKDVRLLSALGIFLNMAESLDDTQINKPATWTPTWWIEHWNEK